jgi:hypothetical protein
VGQDSPDFFLAQLEPVRVKLAYSDGASSFMRFSQGPKEIEKIEQNLARHLM